MRGAMRWTRRLVWGFPLIDLLLAAALCIIAVVSVATGNPNEGPAWLTVPVAFVMTGAVAWRARNGALAAALVAVAGLAQTALSVSPGSLWSLVVYAIVMYSVAATYREGRAAALGAGLVAVLLIQERIDNGVDYLFILLMFGGIWLLGRASQNWRGRVTAAEQRQRAAARLAVAEERVRLARELHDIVAHSLSVIAVQSDAAQAALEREPRLAAQPVAAIGATARGALGEIRQMLDLLRADDDDRPATDSPGISAIGGLVEAARSAGVRVRYTASITDAPLSPAVDLTAYRTVQEGLTNIITHGARAPATVTVEQSASRLSIRVENEASGPPREPRTTHSNPPGVERTGLGLVGMRERVTALGGSLNAGPTADGGFALNVEIPLDPRRERA
ncbi:Signal transduction histidine kinase [Paramicrobacterium humi]|uniref:histidine kinase n=1 Tax=Paramicrobacterium humi TaxID=640635 RepID=A0A1H4TLT0_9MICO|nr:histidine kinase [Microbacterium humi]SEC57453.1 Signal transduction histidine kinase [Microbacterium humi]